MWQPFAIQKMLYAIGPPVMAPIAMNTFREKD
jgi:hypothetical protein